LTSEEVVFESGSVLDAIRATISIPGFFRPCRYKGGYLLDGGIIDPLPIKVLEAMGVRRIIGVNVLPAPKDLIQRNEERRRKLHNRLQNAKGLKRAFLRTMDRLERRYTGNIFNVLMSTIQFMEYEIVNQQRNDADVFIHAAVPDAHWIEFFLPDKFIDEGVRRTQERLADIRQLLLE